MIDSTLRASTIAAILLTAAGLGVGACSTNAESTDETQSVSASTAADSSQWPRTITTDDGDLQLKERPQRIVSTSTTLTGALLAVGAPVVATAVTAPNVPNLSDESGFFIQWSGEAKAAGVEKLWSNDAPDIEKAVSYAPDLIVVSKNSGDSVFDQVDKLRQIAPVLVVDYSDSSWQDVTRKVAEATGTENHAEERISAFDKHVDEVSGQIRVPTEPVSPFIVFGDGSGAAALTHEAPQSELLEAVGFTITDIPNEVKGDTSMGADRGDMVNLSLENIQKGLPGRYWVVVGTDDKAKKEVEGNPSFNTSEAVRAGNVAYMPGETFRLDYYSATMMLDSIKEQFSA